MALYKPIAQLLWGLSMGLGFADFFTHWNGWDGPPTLSIVATLLSFCGLGVQFAPPRKHVEEGAPRREVV